VVSDVTVTSKEIYEDANTAPKGLYAVYHGSESGKGATPSEKGVQVLKISPIERWSTTMGYYREFYDKTVLGDIPEDEEFNLIITDSALFSHLYIYDTLVLKDVASGEEILAMTTKYSLTVHSKDELMKLIKPELPTNLTKEKIDSLSEADWESGVIYSTARRTKN